MLIKIYNFNIKENKNERMQLLIKKKKEKSLQRIGKKILLYSISNKQINPIRKT